MKRTQTGPRKNERRMPALDFFRADGSFLHLEEDWRRGLGWWLVDAEGKRRVGVLEAVRLAPSRVAHELFFETQHLLWELEAEEVGMCSEPGLHAELSRFRQEVTLAGATDHGSPTAEMQAALLAGHTIQAVRFSNA